MKKTNIDKEAMKNVNGGVFMGRDFRDRGSVEEQPLKGPGTNSVIGALANGPIPSPGLDENEPNLGAKY